MNKCILIAMGLVGSFSGCKRDASGSGAQLVPLGENQVASVHETTSTANGEKNSIPSKQVEKKMAVTKKHGTRDEDESSSSEENISEVNPLTHVYDLLTAFRDYASKDVSDDMTFSRNSRAFSCQIILRAYEAMIKHPEIPYENVDAVIKSSSQLLMSKILKRTPTEEKATEGITEMVKEVETMSFDNLDDFELKTLRVLLDIIHNNQLTVQEKDKVFDALTTAAERFEFPKENIIDAPAVYQLVVAIIDGHSFWRDPSRLDEEVRNLHALVNFVFFRADIMGVTLSHDEKLQVWGRLEERVERNAQLMKANDEITQMLNYFAENTYEYKDEWFIKYHEALANQIMLRFFEKMTEHPEVPQRSLNADSEMIRMILGAAREKSKKSVAIPHRLAEILKDLEETSPLAQNGAEFELLFLHAIGEILNLMPGSRLTNEVFQQLLKAVSGIQFELKNMLDENDVFSLLNSVLDDFEFHVVDSDQYSSSQFEAEAKSHRVIFEYVLFRADIMGVGYSRTQMRELSDTLDKLISLRSDAEAHA